MATQGIDYGLGQTNVDCETGIRYGVISHRTVGQVWYDDAVPDYGKPLCPNCGNEVVPSDDDSLPEDAEWNDRQDYACVKCEECFWSDSVYPDQALSWSFSDEEYTLEDCLDSDIFVLKSPYFTYAQFCSPCVPGACNLDSPMEDQDGARCYCLGHEWFEEDKAPYRVFGVADGKEVIARIG